MDSDAYNKMRHVDTVDGMIITEWPNRPQERRYTVIHPPCGVNIHPVATEAKARQKVATHLGKCRRR